MVLSGPFLLNFCKTLSSKIPTLQLPVQGNENSPVDRYKFSLLKRNPWQTNLQSEFIAKEKARVDLGRSIKSIISLNFIKLSITIDQDRISAEIGEEQGLSGPVRVVIPVPLILMSWPVGPWVCVQSVLPKGVYHVSDAIYPSKLCILFRIIIFTLEEEIGDLDLFINNLQLVKIALNMDFEAHDVSKNMSKAHIALDFPTFVGFGEMNLIVIQFQLTQTHQELWMLKMKEYLWAS
jgi:hypothetical protein